MRKIYELFKYNGFKVNPVKVHFSQNQNFESSIKSINEELLVAVTIDSCLTFKKHVTNICSKPNQKLHILVKTAKFMILPKYLILMKSFISSQFNYCPIVWMCFSRGLNNKINHIHERALCIVYQDFKSNFKVLLIKDKTITIHQVNSKYVEVEV